MDLRWLILGLLLTGCASQPAPETYWVPYDGYGEARRVVDDGYRENGRFAGGVTDDVADIGPSLDAFLSPAGSGLILLPNRLDRSQLDFSLDSLKVIDAWLKDIHTVNRLQAEEGLAGEALISDGRGDNSVIFAGLYLGEVIRANSALDWQWERFDRFIEANPYFAEHYGWEAGLDTFVLVGPQGVATPINTALKRVLLGKKESVHFVGTLLVEPVDLETALSGPDFYGLTDIY